MPFDSPDRNRRVRHRTRVLAVVLLFGALGWAGRIVAAGVDSRYEAALREIGAAAEAEVRAGQVSGVSIALVDDQQVVFADGFGFADKRRRIASAAGTVYRAGSISKLFTAVAAMQLSEQGRLDLDKPVTNYVPDFRIAIPFDDAKPITLRQLMCHRSGMIRESPVGNYFDASEPGMEKTLASLASCVLVHPPGTKTKYSNSGVTIVGCAVENAAGAPFDLYQQREILGPLGMASSSFLRHRDIRRKLAVGYLPVAQADGGFREIEAPVFEFGILAAGNLYTTVEDLARFVRWLFANGRAGDRELLEASTLEEMFTPQLTKDTNGFGLGFNIGHFRGRKTVSHMGAVYGFTSSLVTVPAEKIGVIVLCNDDIAMGPVRRLSATALGAMLAVKSGETVTNAPPFVPEARELPACAGDYESLSFWARIDANEGGLMANVSGQKLTLTPTAPLKFTGNGRIAFDSPFSFSRETNGSVSSFTAFGQKFRRVDPAKVPEIPAAWKRYLGSYGPDFIPLIVSVKHGHLYAMTENEFDNRLTPLTGTVFQMPPGLYVDEQLVFQMDRRGRVHTAVLANMPLRRR